MNIPRLLALVIALALPTALWAAGKHCGCACCKGKEVCCCADDDAAEPELAEGFRHLTGIVTNVLADRQAIMVKHDEIPGFMKAMTMMFLVEAEVLEKVKRGDAIKAHIGRDENRKWILRHVQVVTPAK